MIRKLSVVIALGLFSIGISLPRMVAEEQDYGDAFEKLVGLGVPDTKGATYIKLTLLRPTGSHHQDYYSREMGLNFSGNAWLLPEQKQADEKTKGRAVPRHVVHNQYERLKVANKAKRNALIRLIAGPDKSVATGVPKADWQEVSIEEEIKKLLKTLDDLDKGARVFDPDQWRYNTGGAKAAAKVLVLACQTYRSGNKKLGNQLAGKILSLVPIPEKVIDSIVSDLADREYEQLFQAFMKDRDWKAYHTGLLRIGEKYPRGWMTIYGIKMLTSQVEQKVKGAQPIVRKFPGVTLNPKAMQALDAMLATKKPINLHLRSAWLINDGTARDGYGYGGGTPEPWLKAIYDLRMDAIPALAAVAADDVLMATSLNSGSSYHYRGMGMVSYGNSVADSAQNVYKAMKRPCSRGEIARMILMATIPDQQSELSRLSSEELQDTVIEWWKRNRKSDSGSLAKLFMDEGDSQHQSIAMQVLISSGKDEHASLVEEYIMEGDSLVQNISQVENYLKARKGKGKAFFDRYMEGLKQEVADSDDSSASYYLQQVGGIEKLSKRLSIHVQEIKPEKIISDIKAGRMTPTDGMPLLKTAFGKGEVSTHLADIIGMIVGFKDVDDRLEALEHVSVWMQTEADVLKNSEQEYEKFLASLPPLMQKSSSDWKRLLASREAIQLKDDENDLSVYQNPPSEAHYAARAMDVIYFPEHSYTLDRLQTVITIDQVWEFALKRGEELLEKGPEAYFPDAESVDEDRRKAIRTEISPMAVDKILAFREKLTLDEKLAWAEIIAGFEDQMPKGVTDLSRVCGSINWRRAMGLDRDIHKMLNAAVVGKLIDEEFFASVQKVLLTNAAKYPDLMIMLQPTSVPGQSASVQVWNDSYSGDWKGRMLSDELIKLSEGKSKSLTGMLVFGLDGNMSKPGAAVVFQPAIDAQAEKETMDKLVKRALDSIFPKEMKETGSGRTNGTIVLLVETTENLKKKAAGDNEESLLLPEP